MNKKNKPTSNEAVAEVLKIIDGLEKEKKYNVY